MTKSSHRDVRLLPPIRYTGLSQTAQTTTNAVHTRQTHTNLGQPRNSAKETAYHRSPTYTHGSPPTTPEGSHRKGHLHHPQQAAGSQQCKHKSTLAGCRPATKNVRKALFLGGLHKPNVLHEARPTPAKQGTNHCHRPTPERLC